MAARWFMRLPDAGLGAVQSFRAGGRAGRRSTLPQRTQKNTEEGRVSSSGVGFEGFCSCKHSSELSPPSRAIQPPVFSVSSTQRS